MIAGPFYSRAAAERLMSDLDGLKPPARRRLPHNGEPPILCVEVRSVGERPCFQPLRELRTSAAPGYIVHEKRARGGVDPMFFVGMGY